MLIYATIRASIPEGKKWNNTLNEISRSIQCSGYKFSIHLNRLMRSASHTLLSHTHTQTSSKRAERKQNTIADYWIHNRFRTQLSTFGRSMLYGWNLITHFIIILIKISICTESIQFAYIAIIVVWLSSSGRWTYAIQSDPYWMRCDNTHVDDAKTEWFRLRIILSDERSMWNILVCQYRQITRFSSSFSPLLAVSVIPSFVRSLSCIHHFRTYMRRLILWIFLRFSKHLHWLSLDVFQTKAICETSCYHHHAHRCSSLFAIFFRLSTEHGAQYTVLYALNSARVCVSMVKLIVTRHLLIINQPH